MAFKQVFFHRLTRYGDTVEHTIKLDHFNKSVELEDWFSVGEIPCLVQRISFDAERLDIYLKPIEVGTLN